MEAAKAVEPNERKKNVRCTATGDFNNIRLTKETANKILFAIILKSLEAEQVSAAVKL
jgi:hypothetical protein